MALDFHIGDTRNIASRNEPLASFGESLHEFLFRHESIDSPRFALLERMRDYYSDSRFSSDEALRLDAELEALIPHLHQDPELRRQLMHIQHACRKAGHEHQTLWVFCD